MKIMLPTQRACTHTRGTVLMCKTQLCPLLCATTLPACAWLWQLLGCFPFPSSPAWAGLAAGHEEVDVIFGEGKCGSPAHSSPPWFLLVTTLMFLAEAVQSPNVTVQCLALLCESNWNSQQLLGLECTSAALQEKHCGFSAALQEANLSEYQLRLPYTCAISAVHPCWKASH